MYLADASPELLKILNRENVHPQTPIRFQESEIRRKTVWIEMRDGIRLATDIYFPPVLPASVIVIRTPYGKAKQLSTLLAFAQRGYVAIAQDCRGTGESEPNVWEYYIYEPDDGLDFIEWVTRQNWFDGHLYSYGGSYASATQWCMAAHSGMSATFPEVGGLQVTRSTVSPYMFVNGYPRVVGKGANRLPVPSNEIERLIEPETMAGGYFNEALHKPIPKVILERYPQLRSLPITEAKRQLWNIYATLPPQEGLRVLKDLTGVKEFSYVEMCSLPALFDNCITYGAHTIPSRDVKELCSHFHAPALIVTGWYDWNLADMLPSWVALRHEAAEKVASRSRLLITPSAHNMPGYHEGAADHPELRHNHRGNIDLMLRWQQAVRSDIVDAWPTVTYYLMGANEWRVASEWPVPEAKQMVFYPGTLGTLSLHKPEELSEPDRYTYDPTNATPTVGGSIVSYLYPPGSVDLSTVQKRSDVLTYTTAALERDLDVVGPLRMVLYASSTAIDTDFAVRVSDVFPDGRAIQLQNGVLRARYRDPDGGPALLEPGKIYRLEIDVSATANRFKAGHRLRLDISSSDFPRFDRNANRGGEPGPPVPAEQTIYHDPEHPSHLVLSVLPPI